MLQIEKRSVFSIIFNKVELIWLDGKCWNKILKSKKKIIKQFGGNLQLGIFRSHLVKIYTFLHWEWGQIPDPIFNKKKNTLYCDGTLLPPDFQLCRNQCVGAYIR